jgi:hypothetical protein
MSVRERQELTQTSIFFIRKSFAHSVARTIAVGLATIFVHLFCCSLAKHYFNLSSDRHVGLHERITLFFCDRVLLFPLSLQ